MNMKFMFALLGAFFWLANAQAAIGKKDTVMVYQPAPGANDSTDDGSINAGMDTWADEFNNPMNHAGTDFMISRLVSNCNNTKAVGYIRFDMATLPGTVDSVFVGFHHLDHIDYCNSGCSGDFFFARVKERWYENAVTYANRPAIDTAFYGPVHLDFPNSLGIVEYNITDMYRQWKDSTIPNYGMAIFSNTVACVNASVAFLVSSSDDTDAAERPYLKIFYRIDTGTVDTGSNIAEIDYGKTIKAYPNPATNVVRIDIQLPYAGKGWYALTDITGKVLLKEDNDWTTGDNSLYIPLDELNTGMYFYTLQTPAGRYTGKVMKR